MATSRRARPSSKDQLVIPIDMREQPAVGAGDGSPLLTTMKQLEDDAKARGLTREDVLAAVSEVRGGTRPT